MLKVRVIPTLLYKSVGLVKGIGFDSWRRVDTVLPAIKVYNMREVDELILLDIDATINNQLPDYDSIRDFSKECFVPFCVGGGINNISQIKELLRNGADKVAINSAMYKDLGFISESASRFGSQCIVGSVDCKYIDDDYYCFSHSGTINTNIRLSEWVIKLEKAGVGEILITSIDRDGTMIGYDIDMIKEVSSRVSIPVIASGGAGNYEDMYRAVVDGGASAIAAASIFHFTEQTPKEAKEYLYNKGIATRIV
ncbi:MAG: imidazole glycerol phosphate synthase cyclase subunit [Lachnospiraceae bacterium]|nr:imidazole glycerol phosphate synthase cyclase subunit [Lachnospiraceae bacterium]